jgi:hypothetical protein
MALNRVFFVDIESKKLVKGPKASSTALTTAFMQGDKSGYDIILLKPTGNSSNPYINHEVTTEGFSLGVGRIDQASTNGTFTLDYDGDSTPALDFDATATEVSDALNALASVISAGGVTVTTKAGSTKLAYKIVFNVVGARELITADLTLISPSCIFSNAQIQIGDGSTKEIQVVKIRESLVAFQNTFIPIPAPVATMTSTVTGGSGLNEVQKLEIDQVCQGGSISLTFGVESISMPYASEAPDLELLLEGITAIGTGNILVDKISDLIYNITFSGTLAGAAQSLIAVNDSPLIGFSGFRGDLDFTSNAVDELLDGDAVTGTDVYFEGELNISGDKQTVFQVPAKIYNDSISSASTSPPLVASANWATVEYVDTALLGYVEIGSELVQSVNGQTGVVVLDTGVQSVNGQTGVVVLDADDIDDSATYKKFATSAQLAKVDFLTVTQAVDLDTMESDILTNNAKVTNATHTGDATGSTALTLASVAITGKASATPESGDKLIFSDTSDSGNLKSCDFDDLGGGSWTELAHVQYNSTGVTSFEEDFDCSAYNVVRIKGVIRCATVATAYHTLNINLKLSGVEKVADYIGKTVSPSLSTDTSSTTRFPLAYCRVTTTNKILFTFDIELIKNSQGIDYNAAVSGSTEDAQVYRNYLAAGRLNDTAENLDGLIFRCFQSVNRDLDFADFKIYGGDYASV